MKTIGIFIFNDVEELDFVGPYEVFTMINSVLNYQVSPTALKSYSYQRMAAIS